MNSPASPSRPPLILASASPRRRELLEGLGVLFEIILPDVDEKNCDVTGLSPEAKVKRLAQYKGESLAKRYPDALVIAADTIVVLGDEVLEKPMDEQDAFRMLTKLQGTEHSVFSAIAVFYQQKSLVDALETRVRMKPLSEAEIRRYIATGEPMDKAGAYAIQGVGSLIIESIEGCYFNVVGMSMFLLNKLCHALGFPLAL